MVAEDFLRDPQVRQWLGGIEPAWTLLTFDSLRALRQEPSALQTAIRIANDLKAAEIDASPVARNTLILLRQAVECDGLPLTATGNQPASFAYGMRQRCLRSTTGVKLPTARTISCLQLRLLPPCARQRPARSWRAPRRPKELGGSGTKFKKLMLKSRQRPAQKVQIMYEPRPVAPDEKIICPRKS
jgi:hypothetical protein